MKKEVPTFDEWFNGRFWLEWVIDRKNKPTEVRSKEIIYRVHLEKAFGHKRLDEIDVGTVASFRAALVQRGDLSEKRINNILMVLSKLLEYAVNCGLIAKAPKVGLFKAERPEIESWDFEQYARLLLAAKDEGPDWYAAACLAGEAGLRVGEVKELRWREDVDLITRTITVNRQTCGGGSPPEILAAASGESEPDRRVLRMLGARGTLVAARPPAVQESLAILAT